MKKSNVSKEKNGSKIVSCFVCGGNHYAKECLLKHESVNVVEKKGKPSIDIFQVLNVFAADPIVSEE